MKTWALWLVMALYLEQTVEFGLVKNWPLVLIFVCYAASNLGFIWMAK